MTKALKRQIAKVFPRKNRRNAIPHKTHCVTCPHKHNRQSNKAQICIICNNRSNYDYKGDLVYIVRNVSLNIVCMLDTLQAEDMDENEYMLVNILYELVVSDIL